MEKGVSVFGFEGSNVRIVDHDGVPWFLAKDVATILGYVDTSQAIRDNCKGDPSAKHPIIDALGRIQEARIIPESDVYRLIIRSKLPAAEKFEKWVMEDVLPSIRKTGKYEVPESMRARSKRVRVEFTDTLKAHGLKAPIEYMKITTTMKSHAGINGKKKKDDMDALELARIEASEMLARISLMTQDAQGYEECKPLCQNAADTVSKFIESKKPEVIE